MNKYKLFFITIIVSIAFLNPISAQSIYEPVDLSKVESSLEEMGKMWTFDAVPLDYFEKEYGFRPTQEWLDDVMKSALQFTNGCSAAFVSADGLIMTNHHCTRNVLPGVSPEGKDYLKDGYYAEQLSDEIKISGLYVDQLLLIEDVTKEIIDVMKSGKNDNEKIQLRDEKIKELQDKYSNETSLLCRVVQLYNGGKYSLYGYKRYEDLRLVMAPDFQIASTGWDWDNFTYPRYELDYMFFRAYENDKPVKTENFFKFSKKGAEEGELVFVIGRPGSTQRLLSVSQLEFLRDKNYKYTLSLFNEVYKVYFELFEKRPDRFTELLNSVMSFGNARKSFAGRYMALRDEYIMTKKRDFENKFQNAVFTIPELKNKYGHLWEGIKNNVNELRKYIDEEFAYTIRSFIKPVYFTIAEDLIKYAEQLQLSEDQRDDAYKNDKLNETKEKIFPLGIDEDFQIKLIRAHGNYVTGILGKENPLINKIFGGKENDELALFVFENSLLTSKEKVEILLTKSPKEILESTDPFIYFLINTQQNLKNIRGKISEISNTLAVLNQQLGEAAFYVYGDQIPPDATSTLRISDGRVQGYEYNGTIAPAKTTYFGLWDRWHSFGMKDYPWGLHPRWHNIPEGLDLSTPIGFASTNDIVGGNSGSSLININKEVVGLAHDGNLESLAGDFIFLEHNNRTVSTDSWGLMESLKHVFKANRLYDELEKGKIE